ncbi:hypothetical protein Rs2_52646 [Raphanus sativus]|nr:hypothetical protein Rs2_52646 [Raphanus sativus]
MFSGLNVAMVISLRVQKMFVSPCVKDEQMLQEHKYVYSTSTLRNVSFSPQLFRLSSHSSYSLSLTASAAANTARKKIVLVKEAVAPDDDEWQKELFCGGTGERDALHDGERTHVAGNEDSRNAVEDDKESGVYVIDERGSFLWLNCGEISPSLL